jgi:hypothetical protein
MKTNKLTLLAVIVLTLIAIGCKEADSGVEHSSTISAFDRTITVKGDASISAANFNIAKGNVETAMQEMDTDMPSGSARAAFITMLDRAGFKIMIKTGNAGPAAADEMKTMTIGVNYLLTDDAISKVKQAIADKVLGEDAFADPVAYADFGGTQIPIYAGARISNETAAAKKSAIDNGYTLVTDANKTILQQKTKKIVIVAGGASTGNSATKATGVINIGEECSEADIRGFFNTVVAPAFQD